MITNDRFERAVSSWLHEDATFRVPDHLDEVLQVTRVTRQRPAWSSLERWLPVDTTFRPRFLNVPQPGRLALLAGLFLLLLALALVAIGSRQQRLPEPFGVARNGIFVTSRDGDLYTIDPTTSQNAPLALGDGFDFSPIFSRDGTRFVFLRSDGPLAEPAILTMMVANADGSGLRALTPPTQSLDWFDWSPDSTKVAYMATGLLWVVDVAGGEPKRLPANGSVHFPTWLPPDGKEILYRVEGPNPGIFAVAPDGASRPRVVSTERANNDQDYGALAVSPDGTRVTFTRWASVGVPDIDTNGWWPRVYALDVKSGEEMQFPTADGYGQRGFATYSPDGTLVAYARVYREGAFQIVVANADGSGGERTLGPKKPGPRDGSSVDAAWVFTPDGTALLVRYGNDDAGATHLLPLDGSPGSVLLDTGGFEFIDVQRLAP
jgi:Tol biopolymer transport system component